MLAPSAYSGEHLSCFSSPFSTKTLLILVDKRPRDLSPTVHFFSFFSLMLPSTFVTFLDTHISSPVLGFFQPPSQCHSPCLLRMIFCRPSRRSGPCYVPAVGYVLFLPAVGPLFSCLLLAMLFLPAVGPLFYPLWVRSFSFFSRIHPSVHVSDFTSSCVCSPASLFCECVRSRPPSAVRHRLLQCGCPWFVKGLALFFCGRHGTPMSRSPWHSMVFQRRCPRADPRVFSFARSFTCCACGGR